MYRLFLLLTSACIPFVTLTFSGCLSSCGQGSEGDGGEQRVALDAGEAPDAGHHADSGHILDAGHPPDASAHMDAGALLDAGIRHDAGQHMDAGLFMDGGITEDMDGGSLQDGGMGQDAGMMAPPFPDAGGFIDEDSGVHPDSGHPSDSGDTMMDAGAPSSAWSQQPIPFTIIPGSNTVDLTQEINGAIENRRLYIDTPDDLDASNNLPVLFVFHGNAAGNPNAMPALGTMNAYANLVDEGQFVGVYPAGFDNCWQLGSEMSAASTADEVDFIEKIMNSLEQIEGVDVSRIYATGSSNGAALVHYLSATTNHFRAVSSSLSVLDADQLISPDAPQRSFLQLMNFKDKVCPYEGGSAITGHTYMPAEDSALLWAEHNNCTLSPAIEEEEGLRRITYSGCDHEREVIHIGVYPVPWSEDCETPNPPIGQCGQTHTIPNSYFMTTGGLKRFIWDFLKDH